MMHFKLFCISTVRTLLHYWPLDAKNVQEIIGIAQIELCYSELINYGEFFILFLDISSYTKINVIE